MQAANKLQYRWDAAPDLLFIRPRGKKVTNLHKRSDVVRCAIIERATGDYILLAPHPVPSAQPNSTVMHEALSICPKDGTDAVIQGKCDA